MATFLKAMTDVAGQSAVWRAGEAWLGALETLDWPDEDHEKFFRKVTRLAIREFLASLEREVRDERRLSGQSVDRQPALQPAL